MVRIHNAEYQKTEKLKTGRENLAKRQSWYEQQEGVVPKSSEGNQRNGRKGAAEDEPRG